MDLRLAVRRAIAALSIAALLLGVLGLPLPALVQVKDGSTPFPCQHRNCGCATAEQCWNGCCCFSREERVAWARKHGVTPPASLVEAALQSPEPQHSCCHAGGCCANEPPCCEKHDEHPQHETAVAWVVPKLMRHCQGHADTWLALGAITPPPAIMQAEQDLAGGEFIRPSDSLSLHHFSEPAVPPPRG